MWQVIAYAKNNTTVVITTTYMTPCNILCFPCGDYEECHLLGCDFVWVL
jgi:hypothetical protein